MIIKPRIKIITLFILLSLLFACSDNKNIQDLKAYIETIKEAAYKKQKKVVPPPLKLPIGLVYQANVLRTPFAIPGSTLNNKKNTATNPLQAFSLNMLKFIGTLASGEAVTAFILAPDNKIYQVNKGDSIGDHEGKVTNIYPDRLEVMEENTDEGGKMIQRLVTLQLKEQTE